MLCPSAGSRWKWNDLDSRAARSVIARGMVRQAKEESLGIRQHGWWLLGRSPQMKRLGAGLKPETPQRGGAEAVWRMPHPWKAPGVKNGRMEIHNLVLRTMTSTQQPCCHILLCTDGTAIGRGPPGSSLPSSSHMDLLHPRRRCGAWPELGKAPHACSGLVRGTDGGLHAGWASLQILRPSSDQRSHLASPRALKRPGGRSYF